MKVSVFVKALHEGAELVELGHASVEAIKRVFTQGASPEQDTAALQRLNGLYDDRIEQARRDAAGPADNGGGDGDGKKDLPLPTGTEGGGTVEPPAAPAQPTTPGSDDVGSGEPAAPPATSQGDGHGSPEL